MMNNMDDTEKVIEGEIVSVVALQQQVDEAENKLMQIEEFKQFTALRKTLNDKMTEIRQHVEAVMIPAYQEGSVGKKVEGEWGSVTVVEKDAFTIDETTLPRKFFKTVPDETKIRKTYQLEGVAPKGTEHSKKYSIMMKLK